MKLSERIARRLSQSEMKGFDMGWEWNWPHLLRQGWKSVVWFSIDINTSLYGDHSPMFYGSLCVCNLMIFDFSYYNAYHEVDDEEDTDYKWVRVKIDEGSTNREES